MLLTRRGEKERDDAWAGLPGVSKVRKMLYIAHETVCKIEYKSVDVQYEFIGLDCFLGNSKRFVSNNQMYGSIPIPISKHTLYLPFWHLPEVSLIS